MTQYTVSSGQTSSGLVVGPNDTAVVLSGGVVSSSTIFGTETISSGGRVIGLVVSSGGLEVVSSGGILSGETIVSGGTLSTVRGAGSTVATAQSGGIVSAGSFVYLLSGSNLTAGVVTASGNIVVRAGTTTTGTVLSGGVSGTTDLFAELTVNSGGVASGTIARYDGAVLLASGGVATGTLLSNGGQTDIYAGGVASGTIVSSGGEEFTIGGVSTNATVLSGGYLDAGYATLTASGTYTGAYPAGTVSNATILNGGEVDVYSGSVLNGATIASGGILDLLGGGTVTNVTFSGGIEVFDSGTAATGVAFTAAGLASGIVSNGGSLASSTIVAGASLTISSGGSATSTTVSSGGVESIVSGGVASGTVLLEGGDLDLTGLAFASGGTATLDPATDLLTVTEGGVTSAVSLAGSYGGRYFHLSNDGTGGTVIKQDTTACYCPGTLILTTRGEMPVESLAIGDTVITAAGGRSPIKWLGRRSYAGRFLAANPGVQPIRLRAGSLGNGLPRRDLLVSPEHAMFLDGVLVPARELVNGSTIVRDRVEQVHYHHVELDSHDVILAEGAPSESFMDDDSRGIFHNAHEFDALYPDAVGPNGFCAPRVEQGEQLQAIRQRLAGVASEIARAA